MSAFPHPQGPSPTGDGNSPLTPAQLPITNYQLPSPTKHKSLQHFHAALQDADANLDHILTQADLTKQETEALLASGKYHSHRQLRTALLQEQLQLAAQDHARFAIQRLVTLANSNHAAIARLAVTQLLAYAGLNPPPPSPPAAHRRCRIPQSKIKNRKSETPQWQIGNRQWEIPSCQSKIENQKSKIGSLLALLTLTCALALFCQSAIGNKQSAIRTDWILPRASAMNNASQGGPAPMPNAAEKIPVQVFAHAADASAFVAQQIADLIRQKSAAGQPAILGLATGSTPVGIYAELVRLHKSGQLSFQNVITFNLDEYFPMHPDELQSYRRFMREHLFDAIDIPPTHIHIPDGTIPLEQVAAYCRTYERLIELAGGLDLQILGIGRTGHIGFNEPGSGRDSRTRLITLDRTTRLDAASDFFGEEHVPRRAITMGVGTILAAKRLLLIAFGEHKAPVIAHAVEGPVTNSVAASFLQEHPHASIILDQAAAAELTRFKTPWLVPAEPIENQKSKIENPGAIEWTAALTKKAVLWLAATVKKPILKLTNEDYNEHGLQDLAASHDSAYDVNVNVFRTLQETINGWPGGKPAAEKRPGDIARPADAIFPKRILIFSPHPDDDVISMGGTLIRLADQGHEVHVAYQTSGNIAVFDADAIRFADFAADYNALFGIGAQAAARVENHIEEFLRNKKPGQVDSLEVQQIKGLIRRGEARAAGRSCGIPESRLHFMDLPFYETGRVKKKPLGEEDIALTIQLLNEIQPHQIYAAGDLSDPHGTHRVCLAAVTTALARIKQAQTQWLKECEVWLYRGAWQEWEPEKIQMAVPLSPDELHRKRMAVFKHQSQKDLAMFPGMDQREFWQCAEDRNRATAQLYDRLGLPEYEAMEAFVRWSGG